MCAGARCDEPEAAVTKSVRTRSVTAKLRSSAPATKPCTANGVATAVVRGPGARASSRRAFGTYIPCQRGSWHPAPDLPIGAVTRACEGEHTTGPVVVSAGWGRTGTSSLKVALDELGLSPCFHARFFPYLTDLFDTMYDYASGRRTDLAKFPARELFAGFRAAVDIPPPLIQPVLDQFPNAKVILTVRDSEKWYQSYTGSLLWLHRTWWFKPFAVVLPMGRKMGAIAKWWFTFAFGDDTMSDKQRCIDAYLAHNARIRATVPPERLLVWDVKDGWAPLCMFLGVPTPETPFPRHNEGVREMAMQIVRFMIRNPIEVLGLRRYMHRGPLTFEAI